MASQRRFSSVSLAASFSDGAIRCVRRTSLSKLDQGIKRSWGACFFQKPRCIFTARPDRMVYGRTVTHLINPGERAMNLTDKVTIITGSGRGIGRALAIEFARDGSLVV